MSWAQLTWQFLVVACTAAVNTAVSVWILRLRGYGICWRHRRLWRYACRRCQAVRYR